MLELAAVAAGVTKAVDLVRNLTKGWSPPKWAWNVASFGFGLAASFGFNVQLVNVPDDLLRFELSEPMIRALTGLTIGGLASGWHEVFDWLSSRAKTRGP
jgi:hypothetical protein